MSPSLVAAIVALALAAGLAALQRRRVARGRSAALPLDPVGPVLLLALLAAWWRPGAEYPALHYLLLAAAALWLIAELGSLLGRERLFALLGLILASLIAGIGGAAITQLKPPFYPEQVQLPYVGAVLSLVWLMAFGIVFFYSGGLLEVPLGVGAFAALSLCAIALMPPDRTAPSMLMGALSLGLAALVMLPFTRSLIRPGSRSGPLTLGFLLGALALMGAFKRSAALLAFLPLLLIGVPLFAVTYTYMADLRHGWRALALRERREPLDELLLGQGYTRRQVAGVLLTGSAYLCGLALLLAALVGQPLHVKVPLVLITLLGGAAVLYTALRLLPRPYREQPHPVGELPQVRMLGVRLHALTMAQALGEVERFLREDHPHMIVTPDAGAVMRAQEDEEYRAIMNQADLVTPDGAGVVLAAKLLDLPVTARVPGCDLVEHLCRAATAAQRSVYFLGAEPGIAEEAAAVLQRRVPGLQVAGARHGYFNEAEERAIVEEIRAARPGVLFVALGVPRQEKWIKSHLEELGVPVCIGVGGSLDVISGHKQRAPVWMQRAGLEWLYRTVQEPKRLPRLAALPRLVLMAFRELWRR